MPDNIPIAVTKLSRNAEYVVARGKGATRNGRFVVKRNQWLYGEPTVDDLLRDPIVRILMQYDRITEADVRAAIEPVVSSLRGEIREETRLVA